MDAAFLLNAYKNRLDIKSDYKLAQLLDVSPSRINQWRENHRPIPEETAILMAEKLEIEPAYVLCSLRYERSNSAAVKNAWKRAAKRLSAGITLYLIAVFLLTVGHNPTTLAKENSAVNIHYAQLWRLLVLAFLFFFRCSFKYCHIRRIFAYLRLPPYINIIYGYHKIFSLTNLYLIPVKF